MTSLITHAVPAIAGAARVIASVNGLANLAELIRAGVTRGSAR